MLMKLIVVITFIILSITSCYSCGMNVHNYVVSISPITFNLIFFIFVKQFCYLDIKRTQADIARQLFTEEDNHILDIINGHHGSYQIGSAFPDFLYTVKNKL